LESLAEQLLLLPRRHYEWKKPRRASEADEGKLGRRLVPAPQEHREPGRVSRRTASARAIRAVPTTSWRVLYTTTRSKEPLTPSMLEAVTSPTTNRARSVSPRVSASRRAFAIATGEKSTPSPWKPRSARKRMFAPVPHPRSITRAGARLSLVIRPDSTKSTSSGPVPLSQPLQRLAAPIRYRTSYAHRPGIAPPGCSQEVYFAGSGHQAANSRQSPRSRQSDATTEFPHV
jgi:hypothetical protein